MYTELDLLDFVKNRLGFPYNVIELTDSEILDIIFKRVIPIFSKFFPLKELITLDNAVKISTNRYQLSPSHTDQQIVGVIKILDSSNLTDLNTSGSNMYDFSDTILMNSMNKNVTTFTLENSNTEILITNNANVKLFALAEVTHRRDLSTINPNQTDIIETIALAEVSERLISIRSMYNTINTNIGEVSLNLDKLKENVEKFTTLKEDKLLKASIFNKRVPMIIA